jgi:hypothetical protein
MQQVEPFDGRSHRPAADLFNDTDAVVRVDDFITNVKIRIGKAHKSTQSGGRFVGKSACKLL